MLIQRKFSFLFGKNDQPNNFRDGGRGFEVIKILILFRKKHIKKIIMDTREILNKIIRTMFSKAMNTIYNDGTPTKWSKCIT